MTETTTTKTEDYYIVRVTFKEAKAFDGDIITRDNTPGLLGMTDDHYPACRQTDKLDHTSGHRFKTKPTRKGIAAWDGMPWYYRIKTAQVVHVQREITTTVKETITVEDPDE